MPVRWTYLGLVIALVIGNCCAPQPTTSVTDRAEAFDAAVMARTAIRSQQRFDPPPQAARRILAKTPAVTPPRIALPAAPRRGTLLVSLVIATPHHGIASRTADARAPPPS